MVDKLHAPEVAAMVILSILFWNDLESQVIGSLVGIEILRMYFVNIY